MRLFKKNEILILCGVWHDGAGVSQVYETGLIMENIWLFMLKFQSLLTLPDQSLFFALQSVSQPIIRQTAASWTPAGNGRRFLLWRSTMLHRATEAAEPNKDHYTVYQYISNCSPKCWSLSLTSRRMLIGARSLELQSRTTYICRRVFFIWSNLLMLLRTCPCNSFFFPPPCMHMPTRVS